MPLMKRASVFLLCGLAVQAAEIRLGIVGTDTSHVIAFTQILNDPSDKYHVPGARVVAAYKGGSPDVETSRTRVDKYAQDLQAKWKVEIVPDIPTLCSKVDAVLLESVDGRPHLAQARQIFAAKKPVFIDKPLASTLEDAREIARLANQAGVPWFSASSYRWSEVVPTVKKPGIKSVVTWGPGPFEEHHYLELAWYAIHPIEMLYAIMGPGCEEVTRTSGSDVEILTGRWKDGRAGVVHALRPYGPSGASSFAEKEAFSATMQRGAHYVPLVREIVKFFETGKPPFPNEDTLEIFAFMDAAQKSKEAGGKPVRLR